MNDEIREILDKWKDRDGTIKVNLSLDGIRQLEDYITNLQKDLEKANDIIAKDRQFYKSRMDEYVELKKENEAKEKVIKKQDYVINELEKWAKSIQLTVYRSDDMPVYQHQDVLDKLKELKEEK